MRFTLGRKAAKWLHGVGYVCTAIVILQIIAVSAILISHWRTEHYSRTRNQPLASISDNQMAQVAVSTLKKVPSLEAMHGNGFRFVFMPSFSPPGWYALAIFRASSSTANGFLWMRGSLSDINRGFSISAPIYEKFVRKMDALTIGYDGSNDITCLDGAPMAFERIDGSVVRSGIGNCSAHYDEIAKAVLDLLKSDPDLTEALGKAGYLH